MVAGFKPQLAADMVKLILLRLVDVFVSRPEVGAGVNHAAIQPKAVEIVRDVIMPADRLRVGATRAPFQRVPRQPCQSLSGQRKATMASNALGKAYARVHHVIDWTFHGEVARDVQVAEKTHVARKKGAEDSRRMDGDGHARVGAEIEGFAVTEAQPDRRRVELESTAHEGQDTGAHPCSSGERSLIVEGNAHAGFACP